MKKYTLHFLLLFFYNLSFTQNTLTEKSDSLSNYVVKSRKFVTFPPPKYPCNEQGVVTVQISVDRSGNVIKAVPGIDGTTNNAKCLLDQAKIAALNIKMESNQDAPEIEIRKATYSFKVN
jgi:uncharacterized protein YdgA (DUF945 family)